MKHLSQFQKFIVALFLAGVFFYSVNQLKESDSFYHLKTGELVWQTHAVPQRDVFSYTAEGAPWVTHEWLGEVLFYGVFRLAGLWGVIGFVAAMGTLTYYFVLLTALRRKANVYITLAVAAMLGALTFELWIPRPQVFGFLSFALLLFFLEEFRRCHAKDIVGGGRWMLIGAVVTMWFWANLHASVFLGVVILLLYVLGETLKLKWPALGKPLPRTPLRYLMLAGAAAIGVTFLNPNSYSIFLYRSAVEPVITALRILEWKSLLFFVLEQREAMLMLLLMLASLGVVLWRRGRGRTRDITEVGIMGAVFCLPLLSIRHVGLWPVVAIPAVALSLSEMGENILVRMNARILRRGVCIGLLIFLGFAMARVPTAAIRRDTLPVGAVDFIEAHNLRGPLFNLYNEGGYLLWRLWPKEKVFIDGRSEVFQGKPLEELFQIVGRRPGWEETFFNKYHINLAVLPYRPASLAHDTGPLSFELLKKGFFLVYWDEAAMLLVRDSSTTHEFTTEYGFRHISPFRDPRSIPQEERKAATEEIQKLFVNAPESPAVQEYARTFLEGR